MSRSLRASGSPPGRPTGATWPPRGSRPAPQAPLCVGRAGRPGPGASPERALAQSVSSEPPVVMDSSGTEVTSSQPAGGQGRARRVARCQKPRRSESVAGAPRASRAPPESEPPRQPRSRRGGQVGLAPAAPAAEPPAGTARRRTGLGLQGERGPPSDAAPRNAAGATREASSHTELPQAEGEGTKRSEAREKRLQAGFLVEEKRVE